MIKRRIRGPSMCLLGVLCLFGSGCVDAFGGAAYLMDFQPGVKTPALEGDTPPGPATPPFNTYFSFYVVQYVYQTDANGVIQTDSNGDPIIDKSFAHNTVDFEIARLIDTESPCFIDIEEDPFPGIQISEIVQRLKDDYIINDPIAETDKPLNQRIEIVTAQARDALLTDLQNKVKAIVSFSVVQPPGHPDSGLAVGTLCIPDGGDRTDIPPSTCSDDESNAVRLNLCSAYWAANPRFYQGNDRTYTLPRSGQWFGAVNGTNPKNAAPYLGGAKFFSRSALTPNEVDALLMNWQYKDRDGDGQPDYPAGTPEAEKSLIGHHYMSGEPSGAVRGTIRIEMHNRTVDAVEGDITIFYGLGDDAVQF